VVDVGVSMLSPGGLRRNCSMCCCCVEICSGARLSGFSGWLFML
jgi:hypothetical protein